LTVTSNPVETVPREVHPYTTPPCVSVDRIDSLWVVELDCFADTDAVELREAVDEGGAVICEVDADAGIARGAPNRGERARIWTSMVKKDLMKSKVIEGFRWTNESYKNVILYIESLDVKDSFMPVLIAYHP